MAPHDEPDLASRKSDHIDLTLGADVGFRKTTLLEQVHLVHCSLPELDFSRLDLGVRTFGRTLRAPLLISGMTGGNARAGDFNRRLAEVAERGGYAMGLGSQRAMVKSGVVDPDVLRTYSIRDVAPNVLLFGNLGVVQAARMSTDLVGQMVAAVDADALCVHLNPAQEMIQADGDRDFRGGLDAIARLATELPVPVIVKETGAGISREVALTLRARGVRHIDVAGAGGTSWVAVERHRASEELRSLGDAFWDWGIPTAASLLEVRDAAFETVIASGGLTSGLCVAKSVALGAKLCGIARPVLKALDAGGVEGALGFLAGIERELRTAMLLTGAKDLRALGDVRRTYGPDLGRHLL